MGNVPALFTGEKDTRKFVVKQSSDNLWSIANVVDPEIETANNEELITEFSHQVVHDDLADFVDISIQRLRVLRHPNVLKFLSSFASDETIYLLTELVSPLENVVKSLGQEESIKGLRDVATGLQFLHERAMLSHNNLHMGNIFVRETTSHWKIGGFECALELKRVDAKFLEDIALIRRPSIIPPEDKVKGSSALAKSPPYARDMWAFGQLVVAIVTMVESSLDDGLLSNTKSCLLSDDPQCRITAGQVIRKPLLRNHLTTTVEFLEQLTMKKNAEKVEFFKSLPGRLLTLSSQTLCRHIVPLLLSPLVMGEPAARQYLWKHLFTPVTGDRLHHFNPDEICPLIMENDYRRYVLSHIISLLESREGHIRQILLENLDGFSIICSFEDMETIVLPQVLVGLQENDNDLVAATLQGLSKMVPVLGADIVMGTARRNIFVNTRRKPHYDKDDDVPFKEKSFKTSLHKEAPIRQPSSVKPVLSVGELRRKENEAKREAMRNKRNTASGKMGARTLNGEDDQTTSISKESLTNSEITSVGGGYSSNEDIASRTASNELDEEFKAWDDDDRQNLEDEDHATRSSLTSQPNSAKSLTKNEDWNKLEWPSVETTSSLDRSTDDVPLKHTGSANGASAFNDNGSSNSLLKTATSLRSSKSSVSAAESDSSLKGRLKQSDIDRLEEQAKWASMEIDYFADMQPIIKTTASTNDSSTSKASGGLSLDASKELAATQSTPSVSMTTSKLNYVPDEESLEGWNDDFDEWDNNS